jgi:hypothetical protein
MNERAGHARAMVLQNARHATQAAALSPSCPIANFRESGSKTAQTLPDGRAPLDHDRENELAMGWRLPSP